MSQEIQAIIDKHKLDVVCNNTPHNDDTSKLIAEIRRLNKEIEDLGGNKTVLITKIKTAVNNAVANLADDIISDI